MECVVDVTSVQEDVDPEPLDVVPSPLCAAFERPTKEVAVSEKTTRTCPMSHHTVAGIVIPSQKWPMEALIVSWWELLPNSVDNAWRKGYTGCSFLSNPDTIAQTICIQCIYRPSLSFVGSRILVVSMVLPIAVVSSLQDMGIETHWLESFMLCNTPWAWMRFCCIIFSYLGNHGPRILILCSKRLHSLLASVRRLHITPGDKDKIPKDIARLNCLWFLMRRSISKIGSSLHDGVSWASQSCFATTLSKMVSDYLRSASNFAYWLNTPSDRC